MLPPPLELQQFQNQFMKALDSLLTQNPSTIDLGNLIQSSYLFPSRERIEVHYEKIRRQRLTLFQRGLPLLSKYLGADHLEKDLIIPYYKTISDYHWSPMKIFSSFDLYDWTKAHYKKKDRRKVLLFLKGDLMWRKAIVQPRIKCQVGPFPHEQKVILQPHVSLANIHCNLFHVRRVALENRDRVIPPLSFDREHYYMTFRNCFNVVTFEELEIEHFLFLSAIKKTKSNYNTTMQKLSKKYVALNFTKLSEIWFSMCIQRGIIA